MKKINLTLRWGTIVGIWRGVVFFIINDFGTSVFADYSMSQLLVLSVFCGLVSGIPFLAATMRSPHTIGKIYLISIAYYLATFLLIFINELLFKINIFSQREIWYGDAMLQIFMLVAFESVAGLLHLLALVLCMLFRPKRTGDG